MNIRKWLVTTAIVLIMLPLSIQAAEKAEKKVTPESLPGVKVIDSDTVKKWLDAGEDVFIT